MTGVWMRAALQHLRRTKESLQALYGRELGLPVLYATIPMFKMIHCIQQLVQPSFEMIRNSESALHMRGQQSRSRRRLSMDGVVLE